MAEALLDHDHSRLSERRRLVPCLRSSRRVAVRATSSCLDHSPSVLVRPQTWLGVSPRSRTTLRNGRPAEIPSRSCCRTSAGSRSCAFARFRVRARSLCARRHVAQLQPSFHRGVVPCGACGPRRRPSGSVSSRTPCSCCNVHGGSGISPLDNHRRTTGAVTLHAPAAWRTEVICSGWLITRTLATRTARWRDLLPRPQPPGPVPLSPPPSHE
jgi:hypothetical protein